MAWPGFNYETVRGGVVILPSPPRIQLGGVGCAVSLKGAGTRTTSVIRCDQPRALATALTLTCACAGAVGLRI